MCIKLELDNIGEGLAAVEGTKDARRYRMQHLQGKKKLEGRREVRPTLFPFGLSANRGKKNSHQRETSKMVWLTPILTPN